MPRPKSKSRRRRLFFPNKLRTAWKKRKPIIPIIGRRYSTIAERKRARLMTYVEARYLPPLKQGQGLFRKTFRKGFEKCLPHYKRLARLACSRTIAWAGLSDPKLREETTLLRQNLHKAAQEFAVEYFDLEEKIDALPLGEKMSRKNEKACDEMYAHLMDCQVFAAEIIKNAALEAGVDEAQADRIKRSFFKRFYTLLFYLADGRWQDTKGVSHDVRDYL